MRNAAATLVTRCRDEKEVKVYLDSNVPKGIITNYIFGYRVQLNVVDLRLCTRDVFSQESYRKQHLLLENDHRHRDVV